MNQQQQHACKFAKKELSLLYFDELDDGLRQRLQDHLYECDPCRQEYARLSETLTLLRPATLDYSAADLQQFSNQLTTRLNRRSTSAGFRVALVAVSVVVLAVIVPRQSDFIPGQRAISPAQPPVELGIIEAFDFYQNLEFLELLDLFNEMEPIG